MRSEHVNYLFDSLKMHINATDLAMRGMGRTDKLFEDFRDGDMVVCTPQELAHYRHTMRRMRKDDQAVMACRPNEMRLLRQKLAGQRRYVHFSHEFIRLAILELIDLAGKDFCDGLRSFQETQRREPVRQEDAEDFAALAAHTFVNR